MGGEVMFNCRLIGGYNGSLGCVTAYRNIVLPCAPFDRLEIRIDGQSLLVLAEDGIRWDAKTDSWFFSVQDLGDRSFLDKNMEEIRQWYEDHGWKVDDWEATPPAGRAGTAGVHDRIRAQTQTQLNL